VKTQLARLLDFDTKVNPARLVDNADWTAPVSYLDFLRDIGKHFSVNQMVAKESVRARMEDREVGISTPSSATCSSRRLIFISSAGMSIASCRSAGSDHGATSPRH
jgi:hypothetical protein